MTAPMTNTKPYSLAFWFRLLGRLEEAFAQRDAALTDLLKPVTATIQTVSVVKEQAALSRARATELIGELETLELLSQLVANQVEYASFRIDLPGLERKIAGFRKILDHNKRHLGNLPLRAKTELVLDAASKEFEQAKREGQGEAVATERTRLRSISEHIYVIGREDEPHADDRINLLETTIDTLDSEIQFIRNNTTIAIVVPEPSMETLLVKFGVMLELPVTQAPAPEFPHPTGNEEITERMD